jgi:hypothetical protein
MQILSEGRGDPPLWHSSLSPKSGVLKSMKASAVTVRGVHIFRGHGLRVLLRMARTGVPGDARSGERNAQDDIVAVWWQRSGSGITGVRRHGHQSSRLRNSRRRASHPRHNLR